MYKNCLTNIVYIAYCKRLLLDFFEWVSYIRLGNIFLCVPIHVEEKDDLDTEKFVSSYDLDSGKYYLMCIAASGVKKFP